MQLLERNQIAESYAELGVKDADYPPSGSVVMRRYFGQTVTPSGQEAEVAADAIEALGSWEECLLWIKLWDVWPSTEDGPTHYAERGARGERRALDVALGHLFTAEERDTLLRFLKLVLENAWEAQLHTTTRGHLNSRSLRTSHDKHIDVYAL